MPPTAATRFAAEADPARVTADAAAAPAPAPLARFASQAGNRGFASAVDRPARPVFAPLLPAPLSRRTWLDAAGEALQQAMSISLAGPVGRKGDNHPNDVSAVVLRLGALGYAPAAKGSKALGDAIARYQKEVLGTRRPDGIVDPGGRTLAALNAWRREKPKAPSAGSAGGGASAGADDRGAPVPRTSGEEAEWLDVVPAAAGGEHVETRRGDTGGIELRYVDASGKASAEPPAAAAGGDQAAVTRACERVESFRATLVGWAQTMGTKLVSGAKSPDKTRGEMYTRKTDAGLKPKKKGPQPTEDQLEAGESARGYIEWLNGLRGEMKKLPDPSNPAVSAAEYEQAALQHLFYDTAAHEGGTDSINTYDEAIVTWGAGIARSNMAVALEQVAMSAKKIGDTTLGTEVTRVLLQAGLSFAHTRSGTQLKALDTRSKRVYQGDDALYVLKSDERLLMLLSHLSRGELPGRDSAATTEARGSRSDAEFKKALRQEVYDQQQRYFADVFQQGDKSYRAAIRKLGYEQKWPYGSLLMVLHLGWWGGAKWQAYEKTGGDMGEIIRLAFGKYTKPRYQQKVDGATVAIDGLASALSRFGLEASEAMWGAAIAREELDPSTLYIESKLADSVGPKSRFRPLKG